MSTELQSFKSKARKVMKKCKQKEKEQGIRAEKQEQELHEAKTHPNSLQLSSQAAEQPSITAQGQVMVFALTMMFA